MQESNLYDVYRIGNFSDIRQEKVAAFYDLQIAIDFVDYEALFGISYSVFCDGVLVYPVD